MLGLVFYTWIFFFPPLKNVKVILCSKRVLKIGSRHTLAHGSWLTHPCSAYLKGNNYTGNYSQAVKVYLIHSLPLTAHLPRNSFFKSNRYFQFQNHKIGRLNFNTFLMGNMDNFNFILECLSLKNIVIYFYLVFFYI